MPISFSKMARNVAHIDLHYAGDTVAISYCPALVTEQVLADLQSFGDSSAEDLVAHFQTFNATLARIVKSWDVYEDDAQTVMFPLIPARLAELPLDFRLQALMGIAQDIRPNQEAPQIQS